MTTITVVRKGNEVAMAADSLTTFGDTRLGRAYKGDHDKILQIGDTLLGVCGSSAHLLVLASSLARLPEVAFNSREQVFETFRRLHPILKEHAYLNPKEDDDDPYESSQITALIVNPTGIYGVFSLREVFEFDRFWSIGSGRNFALGAMHAIYDSPASATQIAEAGANAGIEFDTSSGGPVVCRSVQLKGLNP
jgi:ATP-dependent protease HslVU (ClpYQ) peptidase subunit